MQSAAEIWHRRIQHSKCSGTDAPITASEQRAIAPICGRTVNMIHGMIFIAANIAAASIADVASPTHVPAKADAFINNDLKVTNYQAASVDLNGDGLAEIIVYAKEPQFCGSGGCTLFILAQKRQTYRVVTTVTITWLPIRVLSTSSHGWSDLGVHISGGGIEPYHEVRLRFDGKSYPNNPTMPPVARAGKAKGRVVIY